MSRLLGPDANSRLVYQLVGERLLGAAGATATVYADTAGTVLANIAVYDGTGTPGAVIVGSTLTVDSYSILPRFWFPDGVDTVYVRVSGGPVTAVNADYDARLDAIASASGAGVYNVLNYGAKGDGVTDDTAAINSAISAAVTAGQANGTNYAEVYFPPATYQLTGATTKSVSNKGNAQIWLPLIATTVQKFTLVLRGTRAATPIPHWQQTTPQRAGSVLRSTLAGQTVDGTFGPPSVVGGPTPAQGYGYAAGAGLFNNMCIVVDGISIVTPANPTVMGFDFSGTAEANVISASANASTTPGSGLPALCTQSWAYGVYMPQPLNNDLCNIGDFSCEGFYSGLVLCEHSAVTSCRVLYCQVGITIVGGSSDTIWIGYASVEVCKNVIQSADITGTGHINVVIGILDVEDSGSAPFTYINTVDDGGNILYGLINVHELGPGPVVGADPVVNGAANVKIVNLGRRTGNVAAPVVPASTVALRNPYWRDAAVVVTGGTVSAVAVDGVAQGYVATGFTVIVPAGRTITLTYTVVPTWKWTVL